jgi:precorrin-8X/cobalt-precorrin-8 methylmutase
MTHWISPAPPGAGPEEEPYRILRSRIDLSRLPRYSRDVTERIIYETADFDYATDLVCDEEALAGAVAAIADGAPVIADSPVTTACLSGRPVTCKMGESLALRLSRTAGISLAAAAVRLAFGEAGPGGIWVVGSEPDAVTEILTRGVEPAFVIALPAGLMGAAEAKDALRASGLPGLTNVSEKGGPSVAGAAFTALLRCAATADGDLQGLPATPGPG